MCHYVFQGQQGFGMGLDCCVQFFSVETVCPFASARDGDPVFRDMGPIWRLNKTLQQFLSPCVGEKGENLDL